MLNDPSAWAMIEAYLDRALELDPDARAVWLQELARTEKDVAEALQSFFGEREALNARGFLQGSPLPSTRLHDLMPELEEMLRHRVGVESGDWRPDAVQSAPSICAGGIGEGDVLGPYRLLREIGHGGMSSVWLAERCDGQLKRMVALKLPFEGPRRAQMAERFRRERDILATLTHANIARLYDAGISAAGQAYLAMEYVHGTSITHYCDDARLSIRERLRVFLQVLSAVEFAHTQLVLHRDLKPSNILVTVDGRVVLLDFGIAKLLLPEAAHGVGGSGGEQAPPTEMVARILTPDYASPEHIAGSTLGTTSDVYSLGVVLYELIAGSRPFAVQPLSRRALEDAILTQDPPRPGQFRITDEVAMARQSTPGRLAQVFKGDLDSIVLKALRKLPSERYRSIDAFARDITNYLDNLPVSARPESPWHRARRFVSRHKWQVATACVALLALFIGGATAMWQARVAAQQRDRAMALASSNASINEFMSRLISEAASAGKPVTISDMLARSEKMALTDVGDTSDNQAATLGTLASLYSTSGDIGKSARLLERALELVRNSRDRELRSRLTCLHAATIADMGRSDDAVRAITRELGNAQLDDENATTCLNYLSLIAERTGDADGALRYATQALARFKSGRSGARSAATAATAEATLLGRVASGYFVSGNNAKADHYFELALRKRAEAGRDKSPETIILLNNWALVSTAAGVPRNALELYDRILAIARANDPDAPPAAAIIHNRARALEAIGRFKEAGSAYELGRQLSIQSKNVNFESFCLLGLASIADQSGDRVTAEKHLAQVADLMRAQPADTPVMIRRTVIQGGFDIVDGRLDVARGKFEWLLSRRKKNATANAAALGKAEAELQADNAAAAVTSARTALGVAISLQGGVPRSNYTGLSWLMLGRALQARGETEPAHKALESAVLHLSDTVDADHPALVRARELASSPGRRGAKVQLPWAAIVLERQSKPGSASWLRSRAPCN